MSATYLIGGSFDPIHEGHVELARRLIQDRKANKVLFVPAQQNPLKSGQPAPAAHRMEMVKRALAEWGEPKAQVYDGELRRPGPSFTIDTLRELKQAGEEEIVVVVGNEVYASFDQWKDPPGIRRLATLLVVQREGDLRPPGGVETFSFPVLPYSGTQIRKQIVKRWKSGQMEPKPRGIGHSVWQYIKENRLYAVS